MSRIRFCCDVFVGKWEQTGERRAERDCEMSRDDEALEERLYALMPALFLKAF